MSDRSIISPTTTGKVPAAETAVQEPLQDQSDRASLQYIPVQCKLAVGAVDDPLEDEADAMADKVMRMPADHFIQRCSCEGEDASDEKLMRKPASHFIQRCSKCDEEENVQRKPISSFIQRKESSTGSVASAAVSSMISNSRGSGSQMDNSTQTFMQSRFGADFSNVNIHTGANASHMNRELNAKAFTVGNDIYFNDGEYNPAASAGKQLLAHELTHTIQQGASSFIRRQPVIPQRNAAEQIASTLRKAAAGWGTNEDAIFNALTGRTSKELADIETAYLALSGGETLEAMLRDELSGNDLSKALSLLRGETPVTEIARTLWNAMRGWGTDESAIYGVVAGRTAAQWSDIQVAYQQMTGNNLLAEIKDELTDGEWTYFQTLLPGAEGGAATNEDRATVIANQLEAAMQGRGTDESAIYAALTGHSESELLEIAAKYRLLTGHELNTDLRDELNDTEYRQAQDLMNPPANTERLARQLHEAGGDDLAIIAVLQGRAPVDILQIKADYLRLYGESLMDRLKKKLSKGYFLEANIIASGRIPDVVDEAEIATQSSGSNGERLIAAISTLKGDRAKIIDAIDAYAARGYGDMLQDVRNELSGAALDNAMEILHGQTPSGACTADQRKTGLLSISQAVSLSQNAIKLLKADVTNGKLSSKVETALAAKFNPGGAPNAVTIALAAQVQATLETVRNDLLTVSDIDCTVDKDCAANPDCSHYVGAWTYKPAGSTVRLCPAFFTCSEDRGTTMLHEFVHHAGITDQYYIHAPEFSNLQPLGDGSKKDSLDNADSYAHFAKQVW